jgi:hypothetical protein
MTLMSWPAGSAAAASVTHQKGAAVMENSTAPETTVGDVLPKVTAAAMTAQAKADGHARRAESFAREHATVALLRDFLASSDPTETVRDAKARLNAELAAVKEELSAAYEANRQAQERVRDLEGFMRIAAEYQEGSE